MTQPQAQRRVPDLLVEKVFLNEATDEERARVMADPDARDRLASLPMQNARFLVAHPAEEVLPRIEDRVRVAEARDRLTKRNGAIGGLVLVPLFAAALALFVVGVPEQVPGSGRPDTEVTTAKGLDAKLRVYLQTPKGARRITNAEVLRAGDRLQLGIVPGEAKHAVVLSIDGRGGVTRHFPAEGATTALVGNREIRLDQAFQLDDAPAFERFLLVTDDQPIDATAVEAAVRGLAASPEAKTGTVALPEGLHQGWFLVRKEEK